MTEDIDFTTAIGRVMMALLAAFAEFFSAQLGEHVKKAVRQRALQGLQSGSVPFGYLRDEETSIPCPVPAEAEAIRAAFAKRAAGESHYRISNWLNQQGLETRRGRRFTEFSVRDMLSFRFYLGVVTLYGKEYPGQHEGIIARDLFERVQTRIVKRGPGKSTTGGPRSVLAGIVRCGSCGKRIHVELNRSGNPLYRERHSTECRTNRQSCMAGNIDAQIGDLFRYVALPQDWKQNIARQSVKTEGPSVSEIEAARLRLGRSYRDKTVTEEDYDRELEELDAQLRMAQLSTTIELDEVAELLGNLPTLWNEATIEERSRLLRTLVEAVYVDIGSQKIVGITPVPAFRTLVESGIERIAGQPAILVDPDEVGVTGRMELVETGESQSLRASQHRTSYTLSGVSLRVRLSSSCRLLVRCL